MGSIWVSRSWRIPFTVRPFSVDSSRSVSERLKADNVGLNYCRVRAFPFTEAVKDFLEKHEVVYVVEQNRDAQLRTLLILDADGDPKRLVPLLHYNGMPINAGFVVDAVQNEISKGRAA